MWTDFFTAAAGASAALAGLVFVALSVNIQHILKYENLPARAGATIAMLLLILVCSMAALIRQSAAALGTEIAAFAFAALGLQVWAAIKSVRMRKRIPSPGYVIGLEVMLMIAQVMPFLVGAAGLRSSDGDAMYWIAAGVLATFIGSVLNAWVLLVEILR